jgi:hypothetical protein
MLVALLSIGYLGASPARFSGILIVRFIAYVPLTALTFPLFFASPGCSAGIGRWRGPPHRR